MSNTCQNCKFSQHDPRQEVLVCHRYPPQLFTSMDNSEGFGKHADYPFVAPDGWCGEFRKQRGKRVPEFDDNEHIDEGDEEI